MSWREFTSAGVEYVTVGERLRRYAVCPHCRQRFQLPGHLLQAGKCFGCRTPREQRWWMRQRAKGLLVAR